MSSRPSNYVGSPPGLGFDDHGDNTLNVNNSYDIGRYTTATLGTHHSFASRATWSLSPFTPDFHDSLPVHSIKRDKRDDVFFSLRINHDNGGLFRCQKGWKLCVLIAGIFTIGVTITFLQVFDVFAGSSEGDGISASTNFTRNPTSAPATSSPSPSPLGLITSQPTTSSPTSHPTLLPTNLPSTSSPTTSSPTIGPSCSASVIQNVRSLLTSTPLVTDSEFPGFDVLKVNQALICLPSQSFSDRNDLSDIGLLRLESASLETISALAFQGADDLFNLFLISIEDSPDLAVLPEGVFDNLVSLYEVRLKNVGLTAVPTGMILSKRLGNFYIQNSLSLTALPTFDSLTDLRYIGFDGCTNLDSIPNNAFADLVDLEFLDLDGTKVADNECESAFRSRTGLASGVALFGFSC